MNADELPHDVLLWCAAGAWALLAVVWLVLHWLEDDRHRDRATGDNRRVGREEMFPKGAENGPPDHDVKHERVEHNRHERSDHNSHGIHAGRVRPYPVMPSPGGPIPSIIERLDRWEPKP